ncbi:hypothetical protein HOLleu_01802 [Holothuria leucospilota]|uniref:Uncharacterized protein n=1 Tax=Holothuria leucospilota TaxID=206669 RepID=A0A9Q1CRB7_HOLLE|nr:hypothetical protein HOLleu_01802 [Holothuria leucospilota]
MRVANNQQTGFIRKQISGKINAFCNLIDLCYARISDGGSSLDKDEDCFFRNALIIIAFSLYRNHTQRATIPASQDSPASS